MAFSIESRVPFLDHRLVDFTLSLENEYKLHKGWTKYILRRASEPILPKEITYRRDKIGFATQDDDWLSSPDFMQMAEDIISSDRFKSRRYWVQEEVAKMMKEYWMKKPKGRSNGDILWKIINTELWLRIFIDDSPMD